MSTTERNDPPCNAGDKAALERSARMPQTDAYRRELEAEIDELMADLRVYMGKREVKS